MNIHANVSARKGYSQWVAELCWPLNDMQPLLAAKGAAGALFVNAEMPELFD